MLVCSNSRGSNYQAVLASQTGELGGGISGHHVVDDAVELPNLRKSPPPLPEMRELGLASARAQLVRVQADVERVPEDSSGVVARKVLSDLGLSVTPDLAGHIQLEHSGRCIGAARKSPMKVPMLGFRNVVSDERVDGAVISADAHTPQAVKE